MFVLRAAHVLNFIATTKIQCQTQKALSRLVFPSPSLTRFIRNLNMATSASPPKKSKSVIGTHDGIFHCDEVLACFMLQQLPEYAGAQILRTRNDDQLNECNIVVDVGAIFDPAANRFDHHQSSFQHTLSTLRPELGPNFKIRLSSAGLVYTHFGEKVIRTVLENQGVAVTSEEQVRQVFLQVYENLIKEIDGIDNGVPMFDGEPAYNISTHLSSRVATFNAPWNADNSTFDAMAQFEKAQQLVGAEFVDRVIYYATSWWPARAIVEAAIRKRFEVHASGEIIELSQFCPWKEHLFVLEPELQVAGVLKYVMMENKPGDYRVICVPNGPKSFVCRKFLHKHWRGLRNAELQEISGISDATFVHASGFIGGAQSRNGSLQMAVKSLQSDVEE